jgi:cysteine desulfurase
MEKIYLDNNATTSLDPRVFQAMAAELSGPPSNPSSLHFFGQRARGLLAGARRTLADFFHAKPEEILFTSGGTESINSLLHSIKGHLITTKIEHSCVYKTALSLQESGLSITYVPVGPWGAPRPEDLLAAIRPDTSAILLSAANNETGVALDLTAIADIAHARQIPLFIDAVAFIGKEPWLPHPGITAVALSGHKFHAPKGIGALYIRSSYKLPPFLIGGNQESMRRAGTENLAGIIGLGEAVKILMHEQPKITAHLRLLRERFETGLPHALINGEGPRISNTSNLAFPGKDGETLLMQLDQAGIAVSHGSACASGAIEPSRVLIEMGYPRARARSSLRFSFSRMNTLDEIDRAVSIIKQLTSR